MINLLLFFEDKNLKEHLKSLKGEYVVITPSPAHADRSRVFFDSVSRFNVITISNFIKSYAGSLFEESFELKLKRKSELSLTLGSLWKMINPNASYELFKKSFTLLTDFRAFSLNEDILSTILENYEEEISNSVLWFHRTLEALDFIDEHKSYFTISEKLREGNLPILLENEKNFIFMGFDFLTPAQIDMIQSLSIRNNVFIPFSARAYQKSKDLDWIKWIGRFDTNIQTIDEDRKVVSPLNTIQISKNMLSKTLQNLTIIDKSNIVLCTKQLDPKMIYEIPYSNINFKVPTELLNKEVAILEEKLIELTLNKDLHKEEFKVWIRDLYLLAVERQDFKFLKAVILVTDIFKEWEDLSDKNESISEFEVKLFIESLKLNVPRNSIINAKKTSIEIETLSSLDKIDSDSVSYFCARSEYGPIKSSVVDYSEDVQKYLATIGPIRRSEFEFEILKAKLIDKLTLKNSKLIIERSLISEDAGWSDILENLEIKDEALDLTQKRKSLFKYFNDKSTKHSITHYSASRLQTYIDCPQRYWLNYIERLSKRVVLSFEVTPIELGLIEHKVLERYLTEYTLYDEIQHEKIIKEEIQILRKSLKNDIKEKNIFIEVKAYTKKTIVDLLNLKKEYTLELEFEKDLKSDLNKAIGSIDCFGVGKDFNLILDFKRGSSSIPSQLGLFAFDKIQLWFYLNQINLKNPDFVRKNFLWGYINLGEPEKSLIFTNSEELKSKLGLMDSLLFQSITLLKEDFLDRLEEYSSFEKELLLKISQDKHFVANPKNESVCTFCDIKNVCTR